MFHYYEIELIRISVLYISISEKFILQSERGQAAKLFNRLYKPFPKGDLKKKHNPICHLYSDKSHQYTRKEHLQINPCFS